MINKSDFINKPLEIRDYSFVVLPDTQNIIENKEEYYLEMMKWIKDNKDLYNIKAVFHMGDIVNENTIHQWDVAKKGFDYILDSEIPFVPMMGNHDDPEMFSRYVKYNKYCNKKWFGESYNKDILNHYYWFVNTDNREYLIMSLGWAPNFDVLSWAGKIINNNINKNVIVITHALMHKNGKLLQKDHDYSITSYDGYQNNPEGYEIWNYLKSYSNVVLVLSGHISSNDISLCCENDIISLLFDNQDEDKKDHLCMMGLISFNQENNKCFINYYSFKEKALYKRTNQFEIEIKHIVNK